MTRRRLLRGSGTAIGLGLLGPGLGLALEPRTDSVSRPPGIARLSLNENAFGPSPKVEPAIRAEFGRLNRYGDDAVAARLVEQIAAHERVQADQVILGEILGLLGLYLASPDNVAGPGVAGGEFVYSTPGYLALIDAAANGGGVGVPVPLNASYRNDLPALAATLNARTRAVYLVNPHNPTGTVNDDAEFKAFLREASGKAVVVVDEAYLEYTADFASRSAVSLVREGANVMVFRTFDKIHGLAGMPMGYVLAPLALAAAMRQRGAGDAEGLGRLNMAAAAAALGDTAHIAEVRARVAHERAGWVAVLDELKLAHTEAHGDFIFFNAGRPQAQVASAMLSMGVDIGRAHPPYTNWARITVGLPEENRRAQLALRRVMGGQTA